MLVGAQPDPWESLRLPTNDRDSHLDPDEALRVRRLSPGQLECLQLVDQHLSSKEIAPTFLFYLILFNTFLDIFTLLFLYLI